MRKRLLSLMLALSMVTSVIPFTAFAVDGGETELNLDVNGDGEINYVALGDSMTNGYGHAGYYLILQKHIAEYHDVNTGLCNDPSAQGNGLDQGSPGASTDGGCPFFYGDYVEDTRFLDWSNNYGYLSNAPEAYPTKLSGLLETATGKTVNQLNLAISGMRAEELRFMLDPAYIGDGYTGRYFRNDSSTTGSAEARLHNARQNSLNPWNYDLKDSPSHQYLTDLVNRFGSTFYLPGCKYEPELYVDYPALGLGAGDDAQLAAIALVRTEYKYALKNAELITVALGTNNFGTGVQSAMYRAIESAFGVTLGDTTDFKYDINTVLAEFPELVDVYPKAAEFIYNTVMGMPEIVGMFESEEDADKAVKDIVETYSYGLLGFIANYKESLKLIREMNEDAPIVVVGAMNIEEGIHFIVDDKTINFGDLYGTIVDAGNTWLAGYVADMDNVYYSETEDLSLIVDEIANKNWNSNMLSLMSADFAWNSDRGGDMAMRLRTIRALNTFGIHNEDVLDVIEAYLANPEDAAAAAAMNAEAQKMVDRYDAFGKRETAGSWHVDITLEEAILALNDYYIAMNILSAMEEAAKDPYINMDSVVTWFKDNGFKAIFTNVDLLDDDGIQDLLYFYSRMMFANGAGVHPSVKGHEDIASDILKSLKEGRSGAADAEQKEEELKDKAKDAMLSYLKSKYPAVFETLSGTKDVDDLELIIMMLKMSDSEALEGVDLDELEEEIRDTLRAYEKAHTAEEAAKAQAAADTLYLKLFALATAVTSTKYVPGETSYYVSFGDSNVNGIGLDGYKETNNEQNNLNGIGQYIEDAAPALLAKELFGENWKTKFAPYAQGGIRAEDLLYILGGDVEADQYYTDRIVPILKEGTVEATRADYIETLKKADLISFTIGGGNVTTFVGYQIEQAAAGKNLSEMDWEKIGFTNEAMIELFAMLEEIAPMMDTLGLMDKYIPEGMEIENPTEFTHVLLESMLYGYASYNFYYPQLLDKIREINPDAQILLLGMFNPIDDWSTTIHYEGEDRVINIGGIATNAMSSANLQSLAYALQNENFSFVDISETETFLDAESGEKAPSFGEYYEAVMENNGKMVHANVAGHEYIYNQMSAVLSGEGYDEELKDLGELVYEALCDDYLTTREKLNILGEAYATAKHEGVLKQNREIAVAEEIYYYLDNAGYIGDDQILEIIKYVLGCALDGEISKMALADYVIEVLGENEDLTDADRVAMIGNIYTILEEAGYLADYEADLSLLEDLHAELKDYLTDKQSVAIVEAIYDALTDDGEMSDEEKIAIVQFVYELVLVDGKLSYEDRVDAITGVYGVLKAKGYLAGYETELAVVEELVAQPAMKKVPAEQAFAIVDYIYNAVCDGDVDVREMIGYIYFEVLKAEAPAAEAIALLAVGDPILSATDKIAIIEAVYEVLNKHYDLESAPDLKAIKELYDNLDPLVSDELALSIIDLAVEALVDNETLGEAEIAEVAAEITDKLLGEGSELSPEAKAAVLKEVIDALKNTSFGDAATGGAVVPALDAIDELRTELEAAGHLNAAQAGEIIEIVYSFVKNNDSLSERQKAQLADEVYTILLNRDDLTAEDKIEIITIIYTVLDEHDYVDANVAIAYMKAYAAAKEKGYIDDAALALDAVKGMVALAKDYVDVYPGSAELKALLMEELENTEETLDALIGLLDNEVLDAATWAELMALEDELNKHIETITELAEAMGIELEDCIADLEDAAKIYAGVIADVAEAAYDYAVASIEGFAADYAAWVESVGDEIDEVNPVLGDAVRKFLTEVPADALSILYAYGEEALIKLVNEAVAAYGDMEIVIADLVYVLNTYGEEIYEAVKNNDEIEALIEDIKDQMAEIKELVEWINDHPFEGAYNASVADKEAALQVAYDQLVYLYNRLCDVTMSVIDDMDEDAAEALEAALDALKEVLCIAGESADGYLGWLADHGEAMGCALLTALLDNIEELLTTACPIVDELIWALLAQVDQAVLEFLPVADQWMYDWLYNNPDKVIAFFTEYGEEIAELTEEYGKYVAGILGYIAYTYGPDVVEYVIENPEEALEQFVAWYEKYGYRVWPMIDVYLEELGVYDAIEDGAEAVIEKIEEALEELGVQLESEIRDLIEEKLDDATHGEYTVTADSYYVAIDEMYGEDEEGYADKLAEHLGIAYNEINELDEDEIAKADLITVRYNNEPMIGVMIEDAKDYKTVEAKDWSVYVGEVGAEYVQQALAEVKAMLAEQDLGTMGDMALVAVESYAYEYVGHMINYIQDLETISEINPDALVISVGMNNALADVVLTLDEEEIALGEYIQYVVDAANLEAFVYVLVTGNAIYVDAPAVETEFDAEEAADVMDFILNLIDEESREVLLATDAGHVYIKEQILGALTITYEGLLGDANSDGVVDYIDAIYVLEYDSKLRGADELALALCDVNGDGSVDYVDAIMILEYDAKIITKFPAAAR